MQGTNFAVYCGQEDIGSVLGSLADFPGSEVTVADAGEGTTQRITLIQGDKMITLNTLVRVRPGDQFSKLVLGAHNYARRHSGDSESAKSLLKRIAGSALIIGTVTDPPVNHDRDARVGVLRRICRQLDGVIFDGTSFFDADANTLLDPNPPHN